MKNDIASFQGGLTLIELLVTLSILAVLIAMAAPNFRTAIENNEITTLNDKILTSMRFARSEAIGRGIPITVCFSNDEATCSGTTWTDGWIIFTDANAGRTVNVGTDEILKVIEVNYSGHSVSLISNVTTSFQFDTEGRASENGTFQVCGPSSQDTSAKGVVIESSGSARLALDSDGDLIRDSLDGTGFSC